MDTRGEWGSPPDFRAWSTEITRLCRCRQPSASSLFCTHTHTETNRVYLNTSKNARLFLPRISFFMPYFPFLKTPVSSAVFLSFYHKFLFLHPLSSISLIIQSLFRLLYNPRLSFYVRSAFLSYTTSALFPYCFFSFGNAFYVNAIPFGIFYYITPFKPLSKSYSLSHFIFAHHNFLLHPSLF